MSVLPSYDDSVKFYTSVLSVSPRKTIVINSICRASPAVHLVDKLTGQTSCLFEYRHNFNLYDTRSEYFRERFRCSHFQRPVNLPL